MMLLLYTGTFSGSIMKSQTSERGRLMTIDSSTVSIGRPFSRRRTWSLRR